VRETGNVACYALGVGFLTRNTLRFSPSAAMLAGFVGRRAFAGALLRRSAKRNPVPHRSGRGDALDSVLSVICAKQQLRGRVEPHKRRGGEERRSTEWKAVSVPRAMFL